MATLKFIENLYSLLLEKSIIAEVRLNLVFSDEPPNFYYTALLNEDLPYFSKKNYFYSSKELAGSGLSLSSRRMALQKCLMECVERLCISCFLRSRIEYATRAGLKRKGLDAIDISTYPNSSSINKIGWVMGYEFITGKEVYIPAQLVYLRYLFHRKEPQFCDGISTGAAAGLNREDAVMRGMLEVVERDAIMSSYLIKRKLTKINIRSFNNARLNKIDLMLKRYQLEWNIFSATNDLKIPVFLSTVRDKAEKCPPIVFGSKSSFDKISAVTGSLEESLMSRPLGRFELLLLDSKEIDGYKASSVNSRSDRFRFWLSRKRLKFLDTFLSNKEYYEESTYSNIVTKIEKEQAKKSISELKYKVYYVDVTLPLFKKLNIHVVKVIIPGLQPLYLEEKEKVIIKDRLKLVSHYFGYSDNSINNTPHPFL